MKKFAIEILTSILAVLLFIVLFMLLEYLKADMPGQKEIFKYTSEGLYPIFIISIPGILSVLYLIIRILQKSQESI